MAGIGFKANLLDETWFPEVVDTYQQIWSQRSATPPAPVALLHSRRRLLLHRRRLLYHRRRLGLLLHRCRPLVLDRPTLRVFRHLGCVCRYDSEWLEFVIIFAILAFLDGLHEFHDIYHDLELLYRISHGARGQGSIRRPLVL